MYYPSFDCYFISCIYNQGVLYITQCKMRFEVGRRYGNMSYFYHVTGLKIIDALNKADEAEGT